MDQSMNPPAVPPPPPAGQPLPPVPPAASGGRMSRGFRLLGMSWRVVMQEKSLLWLPLISMVAGFALLAGLAGVFWSNGTITQIANSDVTNRFDVYRQLSPLDYGVLAIYYFLASFVTVYFNAAIVAIAMKRLSGEDAKLADGFRMANKHLGKIAGWALLTATVGLILRSLEQRAGIIGRIVIGIIGVAWTVITFFVVPVLLYEENVGVIGSVKRSASLFKQRWGEQLTGTISITFLFGIIGMVGVLAGVGLIMVTPILGIAVIAVSILVMVALSGAVSGVFNAALYRYATTGQVAEGFNEADLGGAFYARKGRG